GGIPNHFSPGCQALVRGDDRCSFLVASRKNLIEGWPDVRSHRKIAKFIQNEQVTVHEWLDHAQQLDARGGGENCIDQLLCSAQFQRWCYQGQDSDIASCKHLYC